MSCPNCGYCPSCGRGAQTSPYQPWHHGIPPYWYGKGPAPVIGTTTGTVSIKAPTLTVKYDGLSGYEFIGQNSKKEK